MVGMKKKDNLLDKAKKLYPLAGAAKDAKKGMEKKKDATKKGK